MKKVFIYSLPCNKRFLDAKKISIYFELNGYKIVYHPKDADIIFFFTCGHVDPIIKRSLDKIKEFQSKYKAELIVAGCLPDINEEELAKIFHGKIISTRNLGKIDDLFPWHKIKFSEIKDANIPWENIDNSSPLCVLKTVLNNINFYYQLQFKVKSFLAKNFFNEHSNFYVTRVKSPYNIRVSWGCVGNCAYCVIKKAVGSYTSKPLDEVITEFKTGLENGYEDFLLIADNLGAYGVDSRSSFAELLDTITQIPGEYRIYIHGFDPNWVIRYVDELEEICKRKKIVNIDIPIQSGSPRVLRLMNRYSNVDKIYDAIQRLRISYPSLFVSTHVIVGFPTESEDDVKQTLSYIKKVNFLGIVAIPFSCLTGTKADLLEPKINDKEIQTRMKDVQKFMKKIGYICMKERICNAMFFAKKNTFS